MIHFTETVPIPILIAALFVLMIYPYIGAGILLAALCVGAGYYWLGAASFAVCVALHFVMRKHIRPVRGAVAPSRASRKKAEQNRNSSKGKKKKKKKAPVRAEKKKPEKSAAEPEGSKEAAEATTPIEVKPDSANGAGLQEAKAESSIDAAVEKIQEGAPNE